MLRSEIVSNPPASPSKEPNVSDHTPSVTAQMGEPTPLPERPTPYAWSCGCHVCPECSKASPTSTPSVAEGPYRVQDVPTESGRFGVVRGRLLLCEFSSAQDAQVAARLANGARSVGQNDEKEAHASARSELVGVVKQCVEAMRYVLAHRTSDKDENSVVWIGESTMVKIDSALSAAKAVIGE